MDSIRAGEHVEMQGQCLAWGGLGSFTPPHSPCSVHLFHLAVESYILLL